MATKKSSQSKTISATVGGKTVNIKSGSKAEAKYKSQGATFGAKSAERSNYLKSLNDPGSPNYRDPGDDPNIPGGLEQEPLTPEVPEQAVQPVDPRSQALASLKTQGYASPDEGEIQGAMKEFSPTATLAPQGQQDLGQRYNASFQAGVPKGTDLTKQGPAMAAVQAVQPSQRDTTKLDTYMEEDSTLDSLTKSFAEMMSPPKQSETLLGQYQKLVKQSGLDDINAELIDSKRIIDGTEDDIRSEVTAVSGFATNSQVLAMASARNKTLMQNYNSLLSTRDSIQENLSNSMQLMKEDKQLANERFNQQMNIGLKILDYRDKMQRNAVEGYNNVVKQAGYQGLYNSLAHDPYTLSLAERSLGLASGGLQSLASMPDPAAEENALKLDVLRSNLLTDQFQRSNIQSQIDERGNKPSTPPGSISSTTQAIINNPSLFDDLTPTEKGKVITQLQAGGYDTSNLGLKGLSDAAIQSVSQTQKAIDDLKGLKKIVEGNEDKLGPVTGLAALNPWSPSRKIQADVNRVRQTVGKALEGGVLRKEDEEKYKQILATLTDTPSTAYYKIDALISSITRDIENYKSLQQSAGRSMDVGASLKKAGSETQEPPKLIPAEQIPDGYYQASDGLLYKK